MPHAACLIAFQAFDHKDQSILSTIPKCADKAGPHVCCSCVSFLQSSISALAARTWKYDKDTEEYFVQTADKVKVKKADLERWIQAADKTDEASSACVCMLVNGQRIFETTVSTFIWPGHAPAHRAEESHGDPPG